MPAITRKGDKSTGHDGCASVEAIEGANNFFVNGRAVGRVGDPISCGGTVAEGDSFFIIGNGNEKALNKAGYELKKNSYTAYKKKRR